MVVEFVGVGRARREVLGKERADAFHRVGEALGQPVAAGILDGPIPDTSYFSGKDPAFGLIANPVGAWGDPQQMFDFIEQGGGHALMISRPGRS